MEPALSRDFAAIHAVGQAQVRFHMGSARWNLPDLTASQDCFESALCLFLGLSIHLTKQILIGGLRIRMQNAERDWKLGELHRSEQLGDYGA